MKINRCTSCDPPHERSQPHPLPPGRLAVGRFSWIRLVRLLGPAVIPARSVLRDVASEMEREASDDGTGIRCSVESIARWTGNRDRAIRTARGALVAVGLAHKARDARSGGRGGGSGLAAAYELTMTAEHVQLMEAAGYTLGWRDGSRKYLHAQKSPAAWSAGDSSESPAAWSAGDSVNDRQSSVNDRHSRVPPPKSLTPSKDSLSLDELLAAAVPGATEREIEEAITTLQTRRAFGEIRNERAYLKTIIERGDAAALIDDARAQLGTDDREMPDPKRARSLTTACRHGDHRDCSAVYDWCECTCHGRARRRG